MKFCDLTQPRLSCRLPRKRSGKEASTPRAHAGHGDSGARVRIAGGCARLRFGLENRDRLARSGGAVRLLWNCLQFGLKRSLKTALQLAGEGRQETGPPPPGTRPGDRSTTDRNGRLRELKLRIPRSAVEKAVDTGAVRKRPVLPRDSQGRDSLCQTRLRTQIRLGVGAHPLLRSLTQIPLVTRYLRWRRLLPLTLSRLPGRFAIAWPAEVRSAGEDRHGQPTCILN